MPKFIIKYKTEGIDKTDIALASSKEKVIVRFKMFKPKATLISITEEK